MKREISPLTLFIIILVSNIVSNLMREMVTPLEKFLVAAAGGTLIFSALFLETYLIKLDQEVQELTWKRFFGES